MQRLLGAIPGTIKIKQTKRKGRLIHSLESLICHNSEILMTDIKVLPSRNSSHYWPWIHSTSPTPSSFFVGLYSPWRVRKKDQRKTLFLGDFLSVGGGCCFKVNGFVLYCTSLWSLTILFPQKLGSF